MLSFLAFFRLFNNLTIKKPVYYLSNAITFIPEIWQGHTNNGSGFWKSLKVLNGKI